MKNNVVFCRREFLNMPGHETHANIVTDITLSNPSWDIKDSDYRRVYINLGISDCKDIVSLNLDIDTDYDTDRENAIYKVSTLIDVLTDFREALIKECAIQKELSDKRKEKERLKQLQLESEKKDGE